jgi:chromate transporter
VLGRGTHAVVLALVPSAIGETARRPSVSSWGLFGVFLEVGSLLYGSGYVLLAFLQSALVDQRGWLTSDQLLDAITVGQVTPGPVFTTATFVGWQLDGPTGATVATIGIFAPSFVFVALLGPIVGWMREHAAARTFLEGVVAASLGLMAGVLVELADDALVDALTVVMAIAAAGVLLRTALSSTWLIAAGALIGSLRLAL